MNKFISFIFGVAVGSVITWMSINKKYEQRTQEEIDSVKEVFSKREKQTAKEADFVKQGEKPDIEEYSSIINIHKYDNEQMQEEIKSIKKEKPKKNGPIIISPDEFGENNEYDIISFKYYSDGVLTDENNEILLTGEIIDSVGTEFTSHFGEYEEDSVFVRNDNRKCYYEILYILDRYEDIVG